MKTTSAKRLPASKSSVLSVSSDELARDPGLAALHVRHHLVAIGIGDGLRDQSACIDHARADVPADVPEAVDEQRTCAGACCAQGCEYARHPAARNGDVNIEDDLAPTLRLEDMFAGFVNVVHRLLSATRAARRSGQLPGRQSRGASWRCAAFTSA